MPTQTIIATVTGYSDLGARIVSPRYIMADLDGVSDLNAWVNSSPLPGATISGDGEMTVGQLALGHVLSAEGGVTIGGAGRLFGVYEWSATGGVTIGGASNFQLGLYDWSAEGGVAISGDAVISVGVRFSPRL